MQQAGVVAVLHVFKVQLPVVGQRLGEAANDFDRLVQHAFDAFADFGAKVVFNVVDVVAEAAKHQAAERGDAQLARRVLFLAEGEIVADGTTLDVLLSSPAFAPQVAKVMSPKPWLTVADVVHAIEESQ